MNLHKWVCRVDECDESPIHADVEKYDTCGVPACSYHGRMVLADPQPADEAIKAMLEVFTEYTPDLLDGVADLIDTLICPDEKTDGTFARGFDGCNTNKEWAMVHLRNMASLSRVAIAKVGELQRD